MLFKKRKIRRKTSKQKVKKDHFLEIGEKITLFFSQNFDFSRGNFTQALCRKMFTFFAFFAKKCAPRTLIWARNASINAPYFRTFSTVFMAQIRRKISGLLKSRKEFGENRKIAKKM